MAQQSSYPNNAPICIGPDGRIIMGGSAQSPPVRVDPSVDADARARAEAKARLDAEVNRYLAWGAYLNWYANLRASARIRGDARLRAEAEATAAASWDRWAATPLPSLGSHPDRVVSYPRVELGLVTGCAAVFSSSRRALPSYVGYCAPIRLRIDPAWAVSLDASVVSERYDDARWASVGLHRGVSYSFAHGRGRLAGSDAFMRAGLDLHAPLDGGSAAPRAHVGGHVAFGIHAQLDDTFGMGLELRGLARGGTSTADNGAALVRVGAEVRVTLLSLGW